ncbi:hypothetical protein B0181_10030 [Moraxella caviae]|uniref:Protein of uncharacterized function (DUF1294) n=1 Tax=Moraxella caviae TaxID=34060 RepID=A0A1S9ZW05_9GAMM|nr:hypothetical protein B0181_10030 [Moraxella caviae]STZ10107.1 Protein of uncharacterised function (DUF1294) [Moraxella caviae]
MTLKKPTNKRLASKKPAALPKRKQSKNRSQSQNPNTKMGAKLGAKSANTASKAVHTRKNDTALDVMCVLAALFCLLVAALVWLGRIDVLAMGLFAVVNALTFVLYAYDKHAASTDKARIAERHLQYLHLVGGWAMAAFMHKFLRHKSSKLTFRRTFYLASLPSIGLVLYYCWRLFAN